MLVPIHPIRNVIGMSSMLIAGHSSIHLGISDSSRALRKRISRRRPSWTVVGLRAHDLRPLADHREVPSPSYLDRSGVGDTVIDLQACGTRRTEIVRGSASFQIADHLLPP